MKLYAQFDGGSRGGNPGMGACAVVIRDERGKVLERYGEMIGFATNNLGEYAGLITAIEKAHEHGADDLVLVTDSKLVHGQVAAGWKVKSAPLASMRRVALAGLDGFFPGRWELRWVPRERNAEADEVCNETLDAWQARAPELEQGLDLALALDP